MPHITLLPPEIILMILKYLPEDDHLLFMSVDPRIKQVVFSDNGPRILNLAKAHMFDNSEISTFFYMSTFSTLIKKLVITDLWHSYLGIFLPRCINLKVLHMQGARIRFPRVIKILEASPLINDLAIDIPDALTVSAKYKEKPQSFDNVATLSVYGFDSQADFLKFFPSVTSLTLHFDHLHIDQKLPPLRNYELKGRELFVYSKTLFTVYQARLESSTSKYFNFDVLWGLPFTIAQPSPTTQISHCRRLYLIQEIPFHLKFPLLEEIVTYFYPTSFKNWPKLTSCHYFVRDKNYPLLVDPEYLNKLHSAHPNLKKLSFWHPSSDTSHNNFLGLHRFTKLEYLCISPNALLNDDFTTTLSSSEKGGTMFKRRRVGLPSPTKVAQKGCFNVVFESLANLTHFEIGLFKDFLIYCRRSRNLATPGQIFKENLMLISRYCKVAERTTSPLWSTSWQCLENLCKLKNLTHLTLDSIPIQSGEFLVSVAKGCSKIEFLRLSDLGPRILCCYLKSLCEALPLFRNLRKFRLEQNYLFINDDFFASLDQCPKLSAILIISQSNDHFRSENSLMKYLKENRNLRFFWICIGGGLSVSMTYVKKLSTLAKKWVRAPHTYFKLAWYPDGMEVSALSDIPFGYAKELFDYKPWIFNA